VGSPRTGEARGRLVHRPRLTRRLEDAASPVTVLTAGAGYGKSSVVREWLAGAPTAWVSITERDRGASELAARIVGVIRSVAAGSDASVTRELDLVDREGASAGSDRTETVVSVIAETLEELAVRLPGLALVLDDVHEVDAGPSEPIVAGLVRQIPPGVRLVLTTRTGLRFPTQRLRARGALMELRAVDLAFDEEEAARVVKSVLGVDAPPVAPKLRAITRGWPAAVRLLAESVRDAAPAERARLLAEASHRREALFDYLAEEVLSREPLEVTELIRVTAPHDAVDADLCSALGLPDAGRTLRNLERRGLFVATTEQPGAFSLHKLLRDHALARWPMTNEQLADGFRAAAGWLEARGDVEQALLAAVKAADSALLERLLKRYAAGLVGRGRGEMVIKAASTLTEPHRSVDAEIALGDALAYRGAAHDAIDAYRRAAAGMPPAPAAIAWRIARVQYEEGDLGSAAATLAGAAEPTSDVDRAYVHGYTAMLRLFGGSGPAGASAIEAAEAASAAADRSGDPDARSLAHMALGYALVAVDRSRSRTHLDKAREAAEQTGNVVQLVRLRNAEDQMPTMAAQFDAATETLALTEAAGNPAWQSRALVNRGVVALDLGRYEIAAADLGRAREIFAAQASPAETMPLTFLGELARLRGDTAQAISLLRHVIERADAADDRNVSSYARASLGRVFALTDPAEARRLIERSLADAVDLHKHDYLVAAAWIDACQDRPVDARAHAAQTLELAGDAPGHAVTVASAIEVLGLVAETRRDRRARLEEAAAIYDRIGNVPAALCARLAIAVFRDGPDSPAARLTRRRVEAAGIRSSAAEGAGLLAMLPAPNAAVLAVRVLGGLAVLRDGRPVGISEWKGRKSRDLLKILATRRGEPVSREELAEILWPDEPADALPNRLSVALSLLRGVLDPGHSHAPDHFVTTERQAVALRRGTLSIDLDDFVDDARAGLDALAAGRLADAEAVLSSAEARYVGDLLPEDAFADWAIRAREEARGLYLQVARSVADIASRRGDEGAAAPYLMRAIAVDPYDEPANLELVRSLRATRRHGEARRAYERYVARMLELEIEPGPFPS
jgi:DNA-binding SARP family transcriptional activator/tetratricopeptide (TPR) repeat protein